MEYNKNLLPSEFGLINRNVMCYINSFIQALATCSSINEKLLTTSYKDMTETMKVYVQLLADPNETRDVSDILSTIKCDKFGSSQEDANECMLRLLEKFDEDFHDLFKLKFIHSIYCTDCEKEVYRGEIIDNFILTSHIDVNKLRFEKEKLEDYKCDDCNGTNCVQAKVLKEVSNIIVFVFNQYRQKNLVDKPREIAFDQDGKRKIYKLICQIDHFGTTSGGHYTAKCERRDGYYEFNDSATNKIEFLNDSVYNYICFYHYAGEEKI